MKFKISYQGHCMAKLPCLLLQKKVKIKKVKANVQLYQHSKFEQKILIILGEVFKKKNIKLIFH